MLKELHIKDFAIIDNLKIEFTEGLNLLTGETGSGKSIIIEALSVVLGSRSSKDMIKTGKERAVIEALFFIDEKVKILALNEGIEIDDDYIILTKEVNRDSPSISRINGRPVTINLLKSITTKLIDLSGQHEHQSLLDIHNHMLLVDSFGNSEFKEKLKNIQNQYNDYLLEMKKYKEMNFSSAERERNIDLLKYQMDEIDEGKLVVDEDKSLENEYLKLSNLKDIELGTSQAINLLSDEYQEMNILGNLNKATNILRNFNKIDIEFVTITERLNNINYELEDIRRELEDYYSNLSFDQERLSYLQERLNAINKLKKKYGNTIEKIFEYKSEIEEKYSSLINHDKKLRQIEKNIENLERNIREQSIEISNKRKIIAADLEVRIANELNQLNMDRVKFKVNFTIKDKVSLNGLDNLEFLISTNPGEELKSMTKIVSGGEMSRITLGFKSIMAESDEIQSLIFDEIDTGISGRTAQIVSEKISRISKKRQVIAISHLPQIAALADSHFVISKKVYESNTNTVVNKLNDKDRVEEIARLIGGVDVTKLSLDHAEEMLEMAKKIKKNM